MQRLGIVNCFQNHLLHRVWAVFLVVAFFSVDSWGACRIYGGTGSHGCSSGTNTTCNQNPKPSGPQPATCTGMSVIPSDLFGGCSSSFAYCYSNRTEYYGTDCKICDTKCEADELKCIAKGWDWDASNCTCSDPSICGDLRAQCEEVGGIFHGVGTSSGGENCCRASCNVCGGESFKKLYDMKRQICCDRMQAPPNESSVCKTVDLPPASCGMVWSQYSELNSNEWACRDPNLTPEASQTYREQCFETSSSSSDDPNSGSSSGAGGGDDSSNSGPQYPEGCDECPWLDSILDTLTLQKHAVDAIYSCIMFPGLCADNSSNNDTPTPSDSNILAVLPYLDTSNRLNEQQIEAIKSLDTLLESLNYKDSIALMNDTLTWTALYTAASSIQGHIDASTDTTRKWLNRIFERMKSTNDTLKNHLDSLKVSFVDTSISSLNDSAVKYFQLVLKYDSIYNKVFKDSIKSIHDAISDIGKNVGYDLGYGDTASKTLRNDLENIGGSIVSLDSSLNGTLRHYLTGAAVDTGGVSYGSGFVASGQRMADSIKGAIGWGYVDTLNIDSLYARALSGYKSDSISQDVQDSLNQLGGRLNDSLVRKTDSIKNALPAVLDSMADSLVLWAPFADFDSIIYSSIGARIPNRADCPEDCQKWTISIPIIGLHSYTVDFGLCLGRASFAGLSVLGFLKLLIRIIVAYTCIMTIGRVLVRMI